MTTNPTTTTGFNLEDFAGFTDAGSSLRSFSRTSSHFSVDLEDDEEVKALRKKILLAQLEIELLALQTATAPPNSGIMVDVGDGVAAPISEPEAKLASTKVDLKTGQEKKRVNIPLNYRLSERKFGIATARFPGVIFTQPDFGGHTHPLAHLETMLATRAVQRKVRAGARALDLYGNPTANESFNKDQLRRRCREPKVIETLVSEITAKDAMRRVLKWGPQVGADGERRFHDLKGSLVRATLESPTSRRWYGKYDTFVSIHTLYYLGRDEIASLLDCKSGSTLISVVHRHKYSDVPYGMFDGELEVTCLPPTDQGEFEVIQTDVETGESYRHQSLEWLWQIRSKCWICPTTGAGITWDLSKFTEDTWIVTFTGYEPSMDEGIAKRMAENGVKATAMAENERDVGAPSVDVPPVSFAAGIVTMVRGVAMLAVKGQQRKFKISNPEFYEMLRKHVSGKDRSPKQYQQLTALASRETDKNNNYPGGRKYEVAAGDVNDHVVAAFLADVPRETLNMQTLAAYGPEFKVHSRLFGGAILAQNHQQLGSAVDLTATAASRIASLAGYSKLSSVADAFRA